MSRTGFIVLSPLSTMSSTLRMPPLPCCESSCMAALVLPWNISLEKLRAKLSELTLSLLDRLRLGRRDCRERPSTKRHSISPLFQVSKRLARQAE